MSAVESFSWFRPDVRITSQVGKSVRIRGKAIHPTISGNKRNYVYEELRLSARSLANRPIDVNHEYDKWERLKIASEALGEPFNVPPPKYKGNTFDAEFEDGAIEYAGEINHPEYVEKLLDRQAIIDGKMTAEAYRQKWGKDPICGVSISAQFRPHQSTEKNGEVTPRGMSFVRLSLVEPPEMPGVLGTTINVSETLGEATVEEATAIETLLRVVSPSDADEYSREVRNKMTEKGMKPSPSVDSWKAQEMAVFSGPPTTKRTTVEEILAEYKWTEAMLGEPFGDYKDFSDCVAKNGDKEDPNSYCAVIKRKVGDDKKKAKETVLSEASKMTKEQVTQKIADLEAEIEKTWSTASVKAPEPPSPEEEAKRKDHEEKRVKLQAERDAYKEALAMLVKQDVMGASTETEDLMKIIEGAKGKLGELSNTQKLQEMKVTTDALIEAMSCASRKIATLRENDESIKAGATKLIAESRQEMDAKITEGLATVTKAMEGKASVDELAKLREVLSAIPAVLDALGGAITPLSTFKADASKTLTAFETRVKQLEDRPLAEIGVAAKLAETETKLKEANEKIKLLETKQTLDAAGVEKIIAEKLKPVEDTVKTLTETVENVKTHIKTPAKSEGMVLETAPVLITPKNKASG